MADQPPAPVPITDTPVTPSTFPPPTMLADLKAFLGDLARPFAIIASSASAAVATVIIALHVTSFADAALFIGAVYTGVGALYASKSWEVRGQAQQAASVEIAKAAAPGPTP